MTGTRNRNAWMWVAIAAIAFASTARAEAGLQSARAYAHPVLEFLAKGQAQHLAAKPVSRFALPVSQRRARAIARSAAMGMWIAILPVFFIGLVAPLNLISAAFIRDTYRQPSSPSLSALFQRPPPLFA